MRSRTSLNAVLGALAGILLAAVLFLVACAGPSVSADDPPSTPGSARADPAPTGTVAQRGGSGAGGPETPIRHTSKPPAHPTPSTTAKPPKPVHATLGQASVPSGATYSRSSDGQTFTMVFSSLEAKVDRRSRTAKTTVPISGDTSGAVLQLGVGGFAITTESATARLTVTACGQETGQYFDPEWDHDFVVDLAVPLRGRHSCTITMTVEWKPDDKVRDAEAYINVLSLDARFI